MKRLIILAILCLLLFPASVSAEEVIAEKTLSEKPIADKIGISILPDITFADVKTLQTNADKTIPQSKAFFNGNTRKIIQVYPEADVKVSEDTETIMQVGMGEDSPAIETYYGYKNTRNAPWTAYYRIEGNRIIYADFASHTVWEKPITPEQITNLLSHSGIPSWEQVQV